MKLGRRKRAAAAAAPGQLRSAQRHPFGALEN